MEKFVHSVGTFLREKRVLAQDDLDVFAYGLDLILFTFVSILGLLALGVITGHFLETVLYLITFTSLQTTGGGYHAKTHLRCFLTTLTGWLLAMILCRFLPLWGVALFMAQGIAAVFMYAPIEHVNAPMSEKQKTKMRGYARCLCVILSLFAFVSHLFNPTISAAIAVGMGMYGVSANIAHRMKMSSVE